MTGYLAGSGKGLLQEFLYAGRSSHPQHERSAVRPVTEVEPEKGTAATLVADELTGQRSNIGIAGEPEGEAIVCLLLTDEPSVQYGKDLGAPGAVLRRQRVHPAGERPSVLAHPRVHFAAEGAASAGQAVSLHAGSPLTMRSAVRSRTTGFHVPRSHARWG